jgi:hypothetical protein
LNGFKKDTVEQQTCGSEHEYSRHVGFKNRDGTKSFCPYFSICVPNLARTIQLHDNQYFIKNG